MSQLILSLSNPADWFQVCNVNLHALPGIRPNTHQPIRPYSVPVTFDSHTLAFGASSTGAQPHWNLAFYAAMQLLIPGIGTVEANRGFVRLGLTLVRFPALSRNYTLKLYIPKWLPDMDFSIWKYVGLERDTLDLLENITVDLSRIERKVDAI